MKLGILRFAEVNLTMPHFKIAQMRHFKKAITTILRIIYIIGGDVTA